MKRSILALAVLAMLAVDASACGPVRGFFGRIRDRRQQSQQYTPTAATSCPTCPTAAPAQTVPGNCPGGRCPIRLSESPAATVEPSVVVFATPRRMP